MKTKIISPLLVMMFWLLAVSAKSAGSDTTIVIKTSVVCDMCKERIERELVFVKGVREVSVDMKNKTVKVVYKTGKTTAEKIKKGIAKLGYRADEVPADPKGQKKLPACCKDEGCGKD
ncbi:MAG: heavy-metal-associated domain-containing protein [Flavobacteriales bacterium]